MSSVPGQFAHPRQCKCYIAHHGGAQLVPGTITRRAVSDNDVAIDIKYAGICHSDIHQVREEWGKAIFPMVPGHEIGGVVVAVGANVTNFKIGDAVGVGCMVDSCGECANCKAGEEQFCTQGSVFTYNGKNKFPHNPEYNEEGGTPTYGGYSQSIVVSQKFVCHIPKNIDLAAATPLLCAGITTYSPLARFGVNSSHRVAIVGLGGLGHMGVKFSVAFGAHTTVISRGSSKRDSALNELKAHAFIDSTNAAEMAAAVGSFDFILDCVAANHDVAALIGLLKVGGEVVMVGAPPDNLSVSAFGFIMGRKKLGGSAIGGIPETQEMLDFCGKHNIVCDIEQIRADQINEAYERAIKSDVKYRFVIDTATM